MVNLQLRNKLNQVVKSLDNLILDDNYCNKESDLIMKTYTISNELLTKYHSNDFDKMSKDKPFEINDIQKQKQKQKICINKPIEKIKDLIDIADTYEIDPNIEYNIDLKVIHKIKEPLSALNDFIGIENIKESLLDQILYYIQHMHTNDDYMHVCLYGPPGTGKTEIA